MRRKRMDPHIVVQEPLKVYGTGLRPAMAVNGLMMMNRYDGVMIMMYHDGARCTSSCPLKPSEGFRLPLNVHLTDKMG